MRKTGSKIKAAKRTVSPLQKARRANKIKLNAAMVRVG